MWVLFYFLAAQAHAITIDLSARPNLNFYSWDAIQSELHGVDPNDVTELLLDHVNLTRIPKWIFEKMPNLHMLSLERNQITVIDPDIKKLTKLTSLNLAENDLRHIEPVLPLVKLRGLNLRCNKIEDLPDDIGKLKRLRFFSLRENRLQLLPKSIKRLTRVDKFDLYGTPILEKSEGAYLGKSDLAQYFGGRIILS